MQIFVETCKKSASKILGTTDGKEARKLILHPLAVEIVKIRDTNGWNNKELQKDLCSVEGTPEVFIKNTKTIGSLLAELNRGDGQRYLWVILIYLWKKYPTQAKEFYARYKFECIHPENEEKRALEKAIEICLAGNLVNLALQFPQHSPEQCNVVGEFYCRKSDFSIKKDGQDHQISVSLNKVQLELEATGLKLLKTDLEHYSRTAGTYEISYFPRDNDNGRWELTIETKTSQGHLKGSLLDPDYNIIFFAEYLGESAQHLLTMCHVINADAITMSGIEHYVCGESHEERKIFIELIFKELIIEQFNNMKSEYQVFEQDQVI